MNLRFICSFGRNGPHPILHGQLVNEFLTLVLTVYPTLSGSYALDGSRLDVARGGARQAGGRGARGRAGCGAGGARPAAPRHAAPRRPTTPHHQAVIERQLPRA